MGKMRASSFLFNVSEENFEFHEECLLPMPSKNKLVELKNEIFM